MNLTRYNKYSREDLHNLSGIDKEFKKGSGKWGLQGIVQIPDTKNDFVFFVTFGHEEGGHIFQEGIDKNGVLTWQSQPQQMLHHKRIKEFINHNPGESNIYLLLRTHKSYDYTYLGLLEYLSHDNKREKPVWFQWQIIDWEIKNELFEKIGLVIGETENIKSQLFKDIVSIEPNTLKEVNKRPKPYIKKSNRTSKVKERKEDYITKAISNKETGDAGEFLVLDLEKIKLSKAGIDKEPIHIAARDDYAGYDILSYDETGNKIYIEVKTTKHSIQTPFYVSANEVEKSIEYKDQYYLYRLYDYNMEDNTALFYKVKGPIDNSYELKPTNYIARYTGDDEED